MRGKRFRRLYQIGTAQTLLLLSIGLSTHGQQPSKPESGAKPYIVEWVYKVKWGYADEFWRIFRKYQIATLNREKQLSYVTDYTVYKPGLHTGEDTRWEYTVVITYKDQESSTHGDEVEAQLFPDAATRRKEENRRWEITEAHYDLPIRVIDPNGDGSR